MLNDFFHTNIRQAREQAGLSQTELAEEIGVGRTTIVSLEGGKTQLFNKNVPRIAARLGLSVEDYLCGEGVAELLLEEPSRAERERTIIAEYEHRIQDLQGRLDDARRLNDTLQANVDSLTQSNQYLLQQLRKEQ